MKQNFALTLSLIGGLMLLASACVKEKTDDEKLRPVGSEIIFSAATSYENDDRTRTVYTGKDENGQDVTTSSTIERIDWENNDRVSIVYTTGSSQSEYKVTNVLTSNNENDLADVVATGTKLTWASGDNHVFYAMYPTANGNHANSAASLSGTTVSGTIPASQSLGTSNNTQNHPKYLPDMKYAYMVGYANNSCIDGSRVTIPFTPAVTAFNFIFKAASAVTVTGFEMTTTESGNVGTDLTGNFSFNISGPKMRNSRVVGAEWDTVTKTSAGKTITVNFGSDISLTANQYLDFTVFTLPIAQTGITIKFHLKNVTNGVTTNYDKTLDLKDGASTWHTFAAGKKHVVTNDNLGGDSITYYFTHPTTTEANPLSYGVGGATKSFVVESYKQIGTGTNAKKVPVGWTVDAYWEKVGGATSWTSVTSKPAWVTSIASGANPSAISKSYNAVIASQQRGTLGAKTMLGTSSAPYDLATKSTTHGGSNMNTANCYVVNAPGYYCFPMVYGNAVHGGEQYKKAFDNESTDSYTKGNKTTKNLAPLVDHNGNGITQPYVDKKYTVNSVEVLWQDKAYLVSSVDKIDVTVSGTTYKYVKFYVSPAHIVPGNAVIAAKNSSGDVLWSWHIWVTNQSMTAISVRGKSFMRVNVGWCDEGTYSINSGGVRDVRIRLKQNESNKTVYVYLHQDTAGNVTLYNTSPHYQWGRKDPFVPPKGIGQTGNKPVYGTSSSTITGITIAENGTSSIKNSILNPTTLYPNEGANSEADWLSSPRPNLWNHTLTKPMPTGTTSSPASGKNPKTHGKTVYDPCPDGYTVPNANDFQYFNKNSNLTAFAPVQTYDTESWANGYTIKKNTSTPATNPANFWPALGQRSRLANNTNFTSATANNFGTTGYYHSSISYVTDYPNSVGSNAIFLQLTSSSISLTQGGKTAAYPIRCVADRTAY